MQNRKPIFIVTEHKEQLYKVIKRMKIKVQVVDKGIEPNQTCYILSDDDLELECLSQLQLTCPLLICYDFSMPGLQKRLNYLKPLQVAQFLLKGEKTSRRELEELVLRGVKVPDFVGDVVNVGAVECRQCW